MNLLRNLLLYVVLLSLLSMYFVLRKNSSEPPISKRVLTEEETWKIIQGLRKNHLQEGCRALVNSSFDAPSIMDLSRKKKFMLHNLLVDDSNRFIYCYIPKIACTVWKKIWIILSGQSNETSIMNISTYDAHFSRKIKSLDSPSYQEDDIIRRLKEYKKFLIVRNPLERLFSAYRNKFVANTSDARHFKRMYAYNMMKYVRETSHVPIKGEGMTFNEFLRYLSSHNPVAFQEHWAPYFYLCHPCTIEYDYIGKYETIEQDSNQIINKIRPKSDLRFPPFKASETFPLLSKLIDDIPQDLKESIHKLYNHDYSLFGYKDIMNTNLTDVTKT